MLFRSVFLCALPALFFFGCGDDDPNPGDSGSDAVVCSSDMACDDGVFCNGEERCDPDDRNADADGCVAADSPCLSGQTCDESQNRCETSCDVNGDADGDGERAPECGGNDCDDSDPARAPGNAEVCDDNDVDEDCDPTTFGDRDLDSDGLIDAMCCNGRTCGRDCDDSRPGTNPDSPEVCDQRDNDCDGEVDEGLLVPRYPDLDGDGRGDEAGAMAMVCPGTARVSETSDDCDESDPTVYTGAAEICDTKDNDCDDSIDENTFSVTWYRDTDGDGFGNAAGGTMIACTQPDGYALLPSDCDDDVAEVNPAAAELCNGRDDDCNGLADFRLGIGDTEDDDRDGSADMACDGGTDCNDDIAFSQTGSPEVCDGLDNDCDGTVDEDATSQSWYPDDDRDGFGDATAAAVESCEPPAGHVLDNTDCDDAEITTFPGALERCDGVDNDCDSESEDDVQVAVYIDSDGDGFGDPAMQTISCGGGAGTSDVPGDCNDDSDVIFPGADEVCDDVDQDCDESVDEGVLSTFYRDLDGDGYGDSAGGTTEACSEPVGYAALDGDCADMVSARFPGAVDICDNVENDCDAPAGDPIDNAPADMLCPHPEVATALCLGGGTCVIQTCQPDFGDCNASAGDGCEADFMADNDNCGDCGERCVAGAVCRDGDCSGDLVQLVGVYSSFSEGFVVLRDNGAIAYWGTAARQGSPPTTRAATIELYPEFGFGLAPMAPVPTDVDIVWPYHDNFCARSSSHGGWLCTSTTVPQTTITPLDMIDLASGVAHGCLIRTNGQLYCWGTNNLGQLGLGDLDPVTDPTLVPGASNAVEVVVASPNFSGTCYRDTDGDVFCMGYGPNVGVGMITNFIAQPTQVTLPAPAVDLAVTRDLRSATYCAALQDESVWCWGGYVPNSPFPIYASGNPGSPSSTTPVQVVEPAGNGTGVLTGAVSVAGGVRSMCAVRTNGTVVCWGDDTVGALGNGSTLGSGQIPQYVVTDDDGTWLTDVVEVAPVNFNSCARRSDHTVYCWGYNNTGELGNPSAPVPAEFAHPVANL